MIGNIISHYRIIEKLGAGGMDVACRAMGCVGATLNDPIICSIIYAIEEP